MISPVVNVFGIRLLSRHSTSSAHDHGEAGSVTDQMRDNSWAATLEKPQHAADVDLVVSQAVDAIAHTGSGTYVRQCGCGAT